jgi:hypothetical protein
MSVYLARPWLSAAKFIALALLPMAFGTLGALLDERRALGFTLWRSACRAAGLSPGSILAFTLELLPSGVAGVLLGGLAVLAGGVLMPARDARGVVAAHAGCALGMPAALMLCALSWPVSAAMLADAAITALATLLVWRALSTRNGGDRHCARRDVQTMTRHP